MTRALCLALLATTLNLSAEEADRHRRWTVGLLSHGPDLTGHFNGVLDGNPLNFDLQGDLGLAKDSAKVGAFLDYQGPRFGLQLSAAGTDYKGDKVLTRDITFDGHTYQANGRMVSSIGLKDYDLTWTIRAIRWDQAWIGIDLGAHAWKMDMKAVGTSQGASSESTADVTVPIPQLGLSVGGHAFDSRLEMKGYGRFISVKGAKYTRFGADLRFYPVSWAGLRAFYDAETFDVPQGSVKDDLEFKLDRKGAGFGLAFRF